jgi:plastocyanin
MPNASARRLVSALGLLLAASACGGGGDSATDPITTPTPSATVTMSADRFMPDTTRINAGQTVAFVNGSGILHDVDFGTPQFRIAAYGSGTRSLTFPNAGTLSYHCNLHAGMEATLIVR